jgi:hypothetical protein
MRVSIQGAFIDIPELAPAGSAGPTGPRGIAGPMGPAGASLLAAPSLNQTKGYWVPILGGSGGESGQQYTSQHGRWVRQGDLIYVFTSIQLLVKGSIVGTVQLKNLPVFTATQPVFFGGIVTYSSNLSPHAEDLTALSMQCGGIRNSVDLYGFRIGQNRRELVPEDLNDHTQMDCTMFFEVDT